MPLNGPGIHKCSFQSNCGASYQEDSGESNHGSHQAVLLFHEMRRDSCNSQGNLILCVYAIHTCGTKIVELTSIFGDVTGLKIVALNKLVVSSSRKNRLEVDIDN